MQQSPEDFNEAMLELRSVLAEVLMPLVDDERGVLLSELMDCQLKGVEKFYALLNSEVTERIYIGSEEFDRITDKYRRIARFF